MTNLKDKPIEMFKNVNLGGLANSKYQGKQNSVVSMKNIDIHSIGGAIQCSQALTEIGGIIDDEILAKVPASNGKIYLFGRNNGKVWEYDGNDLTLVATINGGVISAHEHDGYIYYAKSDKLGRVQISGGSVNWSGKTDDWKTFTNKDPDYHPMRLLNLILYIGDGNLVAQVNNGVFTPNALDIQKPYRIKSLGAYITELLIGTKISDNFHKATVLRWNTWSPSFSVEDPVPESEINAFLDFDNYILVSAGTSGNIYSYDGNRLQLTKKITGDYSQTKATIFDGATISYKGLPLFALSQISGNGVPYGIYSFGSLDPELPRVLSMPFTDKTTDVKYGVLVNINDGFLISWTSGSQHGLLKLDNTKKATGEIVSRVVMYDRFNKSNFAEFSIAYEEMPEETSIKLFASIDGNNWVEKELIKDQKRKIFTTKVDIGEQSYSHYKLQLLPKDNNTPIIQEAVLLTKN